MTDVTLRLTGSGWALDGLPRDVLRLGLSRLACGADAVTGRPYLVPPHGYVTEEEYALINRTPAVGPWSHGVARLWARVLWRWARWHCAQPVQLVDGEGLEERVWGLARLGVI